MHLRIMSVEDKTMCKIKHTMVFQNGPNLNSLFSYLDPTKVILEYNWVII